MSSDAKQQKVESNADDEETQHLLESIDDCQRELDSLNEKASEEILLVEQKYNKLRRPQFEERSNLTNKIPEFWLTSFVNHPQISRIVNQRDEDALKYLENMNVVEDDDIKSGYCLHFIFRENPFFTNKTLTKKFKLVNNKGGTEALAEGESISDTIVWKEGKSLVEQKTNGTAAAAGEKRKHDEDDDEDEEMSFFKWYSDNSEPNMDEIAECMKDDLWPNPLQYFLSSDIDGGVTDEDDDNDDDVEDDEEALEDIDEEGDEGEEEDAEEDDDE